MATKYQQYYQRMVELNKDVFREFQKIHDLYHLDPNRHQNSFNKQGKEILVIIRDWESKLCHQSEVGGFGQYTTGLAEKFQNEIRKHFPLIDRVGIVAEVFNIKKIKV